MTTTLASPKVIWSLYAYLPCMIGFQLESATTSSVIWEKGTVQRQGSSGRSLPEKLPSTLVTVKPGRMQRSRYLHTVAEPTSTATAP